MQMLAVGRHGIMCWKNSASLLVLFALYHLARGIWRGWTLPCLCLTLSSCFLELFLLALSSQKLDLFRESLPPSSTIRTSSVPLLRPSTASGDLSTATSSRFRRDLACMLYSLLASGCCCRPATPTFPSRMIRLMATQGDRKHVPRSRTNNG